ncbi:hypothetical protein AAG570_005113 [Ranatra chinensis]|uniref:Uncharacterized protein n=1 Tax=Ranatra chinensis TaxID=642074 RepID=A0ABD0XZJ9_9HEMI
MASKRLPEQEAGDDGNCKSRGQRLFNLRGGFKGWVTDARALASGLGRFSSLEWNDLNMDFVDSGNVKPYWMKSREYWDNNFETRYKSRKQQLKQLPLKVCTSFWQVPYRYAPRLVDPIALSSANFLAEVPKPSSPVQSPQTQLPALSFKLVPSSILGDVPFAGSAPL